MFFHLALKSLWSRKGSALLTMMAIFISVFIMLGIEHIRKEAKTSFSKTVSGVDLIVGAPTGDINLLLYTVFRMGNPSKNIRWSTYEELKKASKVAWAIPISLGDSHKGYRVMGTTTDYFTHFSYGQKQSLQLNQGEVFSNTYDVVLGSSVAKKLNYKLGDKLLLSHGLGSASFSEHKDKPFVVKGILAPTGTPVDQTVHVSLEGLEAVHIGWPNAIGGNSPTKNIPKDLLQPTSITAVFIGLKSRAATFGFQRKINQYRVEPLQAILPGVALSQLWQMLAIMENTLKLISYAVFIAALFGLGAMLLVSLKEREREIAILRSLGARPRFIFLLIQLEALLITVLACLLAIASLWLVISTLHSSLAANFGLYLSRQIISVETVTMLGSIIVGSLVIAAIPAFRAYFRALQKQLIN